MADDERRFSDEEIHEMVMDVMGMAGVPEASERDRAFMRMAIRDWRRRKEAAKSEGECAKGEVTEMNEES